MLPSGSETSSRQSSSRQATSTIAASSKCNQAILLHIRNATSSQASLAGPTRSGSQVGPTSERSGPAPVRVSRFRSRDAGKAMPTNATSGPLFTRLSPSASLQWCLESRLRTMMDVNGSLEYALTWRVWDMPAGLPICALRASARRTGEQGFTGWATPTHRDGRRGTQKPRHWDTGIPLSQMVIETHGSLSRAIKVMTGHFGGLAPEFSRWLMGFPTEWDAWAPMATPSSRRLRRSLSTLTSTANRRAGRPLRRIRRADPPATHPSLERGTTEAIQNSVEKRKKRSTPRDS